MLHVNENFKKLVNKAETAIKPWLFRCLMVCGIILLLKSLICSLLPYFSQVYIIAANYIKLINYIIWKFVNKGKKRSVIKHTVLNKNLTWEDEE